MGEAVGFDERRQPSVTTAVAKAEVAVARVGSIERNRSQPNSLCQRAPSDRRAYDANVREHIMKHVWSISAFCLTIVLAPYAQAGCLAGAAVGGAVGHVAGHHALLGAAVGCALGHHRANKEQQPDPHHQDSSH